MVNAYFSSELLQKQILVVGAGGIGCELLKNLAIAGFQNIHLIDLDTIDVSNLNRQFLFRKEHVGKSKAEVAAAAAIEMRPGINVVHYHDSIFNNRFDLDFFKGFSIVLNALDNLQARRHVNRLCISANVPLIDGGTTGFLGQVRVIKRGVTECFDCVEHPVQRTFPSCTIRNTPSEFIHCIVWAKALLSQLFGEADIDDDIAPYEEEKTNGTEKEENGVENGHSKLAENGTAEKENGINGSAKHTNGTEQKTSLSTRQFATSNDYEPIELYNKLFVRDINYLLEMKNLWKDRQPPEPFLTDDLNLEVGQPVSATNALWPLEQWISTFDKTLRTLALRFKEGDKEGKILTWDKDDDDALQFVAACSNIRAHIFHIKGKSLFDVKSMAGNIIPAIATSNAIIAALMVVETYKVLDGKFNKIQSSFIAPRPNARGKILSDDQPVPPNPKCYVCAEKHELHIKLNIAKMTLKTFVMDVMKKGIGMLAPDVTDMSTGTIICSSDEQTIANETHTLEQKTVKHLCILDCDDFQQELNLKMIVINDPSLEEDEFAIVSDSQIKSESAVDEKMNTTPQLNDSRKRAAAESLDSSLNKRSRVEETA